MSRPHARSGRHRRLSAERQIQSLPRLEGGTYPGAGQHSQGAAAGHRPRVRAERTVAVVVAGMSWLAFWDSPHSIYVNARHKDVHYRVIAQAIAALVPLPHARVLDYGSGEALHAGIVADTAGELLLCEGAPGV